MTTIRCSIAWTWTSCSLPSLCEPLVGRLPRHRPQAARHNRQIRPSDYGQPDYRTPGMSAIISLNRAPILCYIFAGFQPSLIMPL